MIINETEMKMAALVCNEEFSNFKDEFKRLVSAQYNLSAVECGRWARKDFESVLTTETMSLSTEELRALRLENLRKHFKVSADKAVVKLNILNRKYFEVTGRYIMSYVENRDRILRKELISLAKVA